MIKKQFSVPAVFFLLMVVFFFQTACTGAPEANPETQVQVQEPLEQSAPQQDGGSGDAENTEGAKEQKAPDYAEIRPRAQMQDKLTVVFGRGELELDFRKSYLASEAQIFTALYEGLFSYHPFTMEPVPAAAESYEISKDKKQWTFKIRENARFWTGEPLRAEDFRAAWLSLIDPKRESPYSSLFDIIEGAKEFRTGQNNNPDSVGIRVPNEKTLVVRLNAPASFFSSMLCHHSFSPIHPSMLEKENWLVTPLYSNGPFVLKKITEDRLVFEKNPHYWDAGRMALNQLTVRFTEEPEDATALWNSGEARWISGDLDLEALTDRSGIQVNPMFATHYYFFRSEKKPWDDHRLRRALALALPWDKIREGVWLPAQTLIFPLPGYPKLEGLNEADLEESKKLLAEAGYAGGEGLPELVIRLTPSREATRIGGLMAQTWKEELGVPVRVEVIPYGQYFQSMRSGNYEIGSSTWIGDFADPYTFLQMWRRDSNLNDACLDDADYESLIEKSMTEEGEKRFETMAEAEKLLLERGSVMPISFSPAINIIDTDEIDGWFPNPLDIHPFKYLSFKAFKPLPGVALVEF